MNFILTIIAEILSVRISLISGKITKLTEEIESLHFCQKSAQAQVTEKMKLEIKLKKLESKCDSILKRIDDAEKIQPGKVS